MNISVNPSLQELHATVENLTAAVLACVTKETLIREILDTEREQILNELEAVKQVIAAKNLEVDTLTFDAEIKQFGWLKREPNRQRGSYFGQVVALNHQACLCLIKSNGRDVIELLFSALAEGQSKPMLGESLRMVFKDDVVVVSLAERFGRRLNEQQI